MKKKTLLLLVALIAGAAAIFYYYRSKQKVQQVTFASAKAQYGYIGKSVTATGTIEPLDTVSVGAQVSGVVKKVFVDYNSVVKKGQLLAQVDASILTAQDEESKAGLLNARSNLELQQNTFDRQSKLFNLGAISKADYQVALNSYNSAKAAVDNAHAQLNAANKTLSYTNIYSPVNGVVLNRNISEGQTIASSFSAPVLFVIAKDLTKMQVNAAVDEADIGGLVSGQNVSFSVDAFPNDIFKGKVQEILLHPSVSANVVTYTTLVNVDNTLLKLMPGMTASINVFTEEDSNALLIPARAINFKPDSSMLKQYKIISAEKITYNPAQGDTAKRNYQKETVKKSGAAKGEIHPSFVWIKSGDTLTERRIITGLADDVNVKVLHGLSPGEEIITNIVSPGNKNNADKTQRSPFMPQQQQKLPSGKKN
ncbi:MAG: efflux RND transporter periplasmic adaptor subunit [Rhizobacter sp.]|nr:efflux RND transporter periplasmic adaptor subunit [Ferruginibacter sp.]